MFKKITVSAALSTTLIFGGVFATSVNASESTQAQPEQNTTYYTLNSTQNLFSNNTINEFFTQFYNKYNSNQQKTNENNSNNTSDKQTGSNQQDQAAQQQPKQRSNKPAQQSEQTDQQSSQASESTSPALSQYEQQVVELTNEKRADHGLEPLKVDKKLSKVAREKSNDMMSNNYFSHNSPNYGSPFDMMKSYGISYKTGGENIAKGQPTPEAVVNAWMNSKGHRENILNENFTHIGVGYVEQGNHWTQQFIGK